MKSNAQSSVAKNKLPAASLALSEITKIADACASIADEVADDTGFVSVRRLLSRFRARLVVRPLLVEGMLASIRDEAKTASEKTRWAVLVDEDTYRVSPEDIAAEIRGRALPPRLRNTIAHELTHTLAFEPCEFGIRLKANFDTDKGRSLLLREIERQTERLSPLLLWPEKAIAAMLSMRHENLGISELTDARESMGVSRELLITRLCLLRQDDPHRFLFSLGLRNLAIGIAEWGAGKIASVKGWPVFQNFDENTAPAFIHRLMAMKQVWANDIFSVDNFIMCGGNETCLDLETGAGTAASPNATRMRIEISAEDRDRRPGRRFLFAVRGKL